MPAVALLQFLRRSGATVSLAPEDRVRVEAPPGLLDNALRVAIRAERDDLIALLRAEETSDAIDSKFASFASGSSEMCAPGDEPRTVWTQRTQTSENNVEADGVDLPARVAGAWGSGLQHLARQRAPRGFTEERWRVGVRWCLTLARENGDTGLECGWAAAELFGLHPVAPATRYDAMGVAFLLRPWDRILDVGEERTLVLRRTGAVHRFYRASHSAESRPAWLLPSRPHQHAPVRSS